MNRCLYCDDCIPEKTVGGKPRKYCNKSCSRKHYIANNPEALSNSAKKAFVTLNENNPDVIRHRGRSTEKKRSASKRLYDSGHYHRMSKIGSGVMLDRYSDYFIRKLERETKIKSGKWVDYSIFDYDDVKKYTSAVRRLTVKLYGSAGEDNEWDHIIPISKAYILGLSPEKICHTDNIRRIPRTDNRSKGNKITEEAITLLDAWGIQTDNLF